VSHAFIEQPERSVPLIPVTEETLEDVLASRPERWRNWSRERGFRAKPDGFLCIPSAEGRTEAVLIAHDPGQALWMLASAARKLEPGAYHLDAYGLDDALRLPATVGWGLAGYRFERYRSAGQEQPRLVWPPGVDRARVLALVSAHQLVRDLINTPAKDLMPEDLAQAVTVLAEEFHAAVEIREGESIALDYPCVHAVGSASAHAPRVLEMTWGEAGDPHLVLVGKGVCFDSGGLNLKTGNGMRLMKKDMGGAAIALGLARAIMALRLPVRFTVLLGAVENAVGSRAFRPGDVLTARNGKTIEIDNTDAEGRLVLADLLVRAGELNPDLVVDFATLTGAARVAVGTEISAFFSTDPGISEALKEPSARWDDPVWGLPLHQPYRHLLKSDIADIVNSSSGGYAGAITAALFLQEFVPKDVPWLHFDVMAWNTRARPGRPKGGEAMGLRTLLDFLESRYRRG
jgi:leucyl aminopeptidase